METKNNHIITLTDEQQADIGRTLVEYAEWMDYRLRYVEKEDKELCEKKRKTALALHDIVCKARR